MRSGARQPAWRANLDLKFEYRGDRTVMSAARHQGPLYVQRPFYPQDGLCHTYLLHPPGGLVGGDELQINALLTKRAEVLLTTPAATKFYRSAGGLAKQHVRLHLDDGACCEWLPQENIMFDGSLSAVVTDIELAANARLIAWETTCLGRPAAQAPYRRGHHRQRFSIKRDGKLLYADRLNLHGDKDAYHASWGLRGHAVSSLLVASPANEAALTTARSTITGYNNNNGIQACTLIDRLLLCRCLSDNLQSLHRLMVAWWRNLRPLVITREACAPRIWAT